MTYEEWLRELWLVCKKKKAEGRDLPALYKCLKEDCSKESAGLFSQVTSNKMQGNGFKLHQGGFRLDI